MVPKFRFIFSLLVLVPGCRESSASVAGPGRGTAIHEAATPAAGSSQPSSRPLSTKVGRPAPPFELPDLDGKKVRLSDFKGKVVVLEWFNPECPFVRAAHTKGSLVDAAARLQRDGVVYLSINSAGRGKQGYGVAANRRGVSQFKMEHAVLLDEGGSVGREYGAVNTPHSFVIDAKGILVYRGAVDNSPDGEGESPEGGKLVRYMEEAARATLSGKPVAVPETKAYGCSVKYGE